MQGGNLQDRWRTTPAGNYLDARAGELILSLADPRAGERLLDVGCGNGGHLELFRQAGCDLTGIDPDPSRLAEAGQRLGRRAEFRQGRADDLPFPDNAFDLVTLIASAEFAAAPGRALAEAIRVSGGRVFVGFPNRWSLIGLQGRLPSLFPGPSDDHPIRPLPLSRVTALIRERLPDAAIRWGSVLFLPWGCYDSGTGGIERRIPVRKNPFGAFIGLTFSVTFSLRTLQELIRDPVPAGPDGRTPLPEVVRGASA